MRSSDGVAILLACLGLYMGVSFPVACDLMEFDEPFRSISDYLCDTLLLSVLIHALVIVFCLTLFQLVAFVWAMSGFLAKRRPSGKGHSRVKMLLLAPMPFLIPGVIWCLFRCCLLAHRGGLLVCEPGWLSWWGFPILGSGWLWIAGFVLMALNATRGLLKLPTIPIPLVDETPHCRQCGYNLTGNTSGICSECGTPIPEDVKKKLVSEESEPTG